MNFQDKNYLHLLNYGIGADGSFLSWRMMNFVLVRYDGVVSGCNCWKMPKSFLIKKGREYGSLSPNPGFQTDPAVTEGERGIFACFKISFLFIIIIIILYNFFRGQAFVFCLVVSFCALAWHREICWLYSLGNTCWFFSLAYLFRSNERVGKGIGLKNRTTFQAETPRKR